MNVPARILIVDDSPDDVELMVRALRHGGCDIVCKRVDTPQAMQAALARGDWDLVIADYSMPRFDGIAALKLLRKEWRGATCLLSWSRARWARPSQSRPSRQERMTIS